MKISGAFYTRFLTMLLVIASSARAATPETACLAPDLDHAARVELFKIFRAVRLYCGKHNRSPSLKLDDTAYLPSELMGTQFKLEMRYARKCAFTATITDQRPSGPRQLSINQDGEYSGIAAISSVDDAAAFIRLDLRVVLDRELDFHEETGHFTRNAKDLYFSPFPALKKDYTLTIATSGDDSFKATYKGKIDGKKLELSMDDTGKIEGGRQFDSPSDAATFMKEKLIHIYNAEKARFLDKGNFTDDLDALDVEYMDHLREYGMVFIRTQPRSFTAVIAGQGQMRGHFFSINEKKDLVSASAPCTPVPSGSPEPSPLLTAGPMPTFTVKASGGTKPATPVPRPSRPGR